MKAAAIVLDKEGRLLVVRKKDSDLWISLGGKPEIGENLENALMREVMEEVGLTVLGKPELFHTSPIEPAAGKPDITVQIFSYLTKVIGDPTINPADRIGEFHWLSKAEFDKKQYKLGSVLELYVIPSLIDKGLLK